MSELREKWKGITPSLYCYCNNPDLENYLGKMYPVELEIKNRTDNNTSASYLD